MLRKEPWGPPTFNREMKGKVTDKAGRQKGGTGALRDRYNSRTELSRRRCQAS